jgi:hypothetical protein
MVKFPMKRYDINGSSTIFEGKIHDRMMDDNLTPWAREMMIAKLVSMMPDKKAFRPYTMAKILGIHGKTASRLIAEARRKWYEKNWLSIELEKVRLLSQIEDSEAEMVNHPTTCNCAKKIAEYQKKTNDEINKRVWVEVAQENRAILLAGN